MRCSVPAKPGPETFNSSGAVAPQLLANRSVSCWLMEDDLGARKVSETAPGSIREQVRAPSLACASRGLAPGHRPETIRRTFPDRVSRVSVPTPTVEAIGPRKHCQ